MKEGINPNLAANTGCTPVWIASSNGHHKCMEILIMYGADVDKPEQSDGITPLFAAAGNGNRKAVEILLASKADINKATESGKFSPLMIAAQKEHYQVVNVLLKSDADAFQVNTAGGDAFLLASAYGHLECIKVIHKHLLSGMDMIKLLIYYYNLMLIHFKWMKMDMMHLLLLH